MPRARLTSDPGDDISPLWSPDDRSIVFASARPAGRLSLYKKLVGAPLGAEPQFSPDGRFIAYQSNRTGRDEIYLRPFPGPGADVQVSTEGGSQARWHPIGGKELFYVGGGDRLMAVPIRLASDGKSVEPGTPLGLLATNIGSTVLLKYRQQYLVSPDGQSFVMNSAVDEGSASPITVLLNWKPAR